MLDTDLPADELESETSIILALYAKEPEEQLTASAVLILKIVQEEYVGKMILFISNVMISYVFLKVFGCFTYNSFPGRIERLIMQFYKDKTLINKFKVLCKCISVKK